MGLKTRIMHRITQIADRMGSHMYGANTAAGAPIDANTEHNNKVAATVAQIQ